MPYSYSQKTSVSTKRPQGKRRLPAMLLLTASVIISLEAMPLSGFAQALTADPSQAAKLQITRSPNGVPLVNIVAPNSAGLSHNKFLDYNVGPQGLILNNSKDLVAQSRLGGAIIGNPNLANTASAQVILNEVTSQNRSDLQGYTEVHGAPADVIVANPNGITCNGCGFVNTPHATLTTGTPIVGSTGSLDGFHVAQGDIQFGSNGADVRNVDVMDIITRKVDVSGAIHGQAIRVYAGAQDVSYAGANDIAVAHGIAAGDAPQLAVSSSALGGMYGDRLLIVSTDKGAGVAMQGELAANAGELRLQADGKIVFDRLSSLSGVVVQATGATNSIQGNMVRATGPVKLQGEADVSLGQVDTAQSLRVAGKNISAGQFTSATDISLFGSGRISGQSLASSGGSVLVNGASVGLDQVLASRDIVLQSNGSVGGQGTQGITLAAGHNVNLSSGGDVKAAALTAGQVLQADVAGGFAAQMISGASISVAAQAVNVSAAQSHDGIAIHTSSGELRLDQAVADGNITLASDRGDISLQRLVANQHDITLRTTGDVVGTTDLHDSTGAAISNLAAGGLLQVQAHQIDVNRSVAGGNLLFDADTVLANGAMSQGNMLLQAQHDLGVSTAVAAGKLGVRSIAGGVSAGTLLSAQDLAVRGGTGVNVAQALSQGAMGMAADTGSVVLGAAHAVGNMRVMGANIVAGELQSQQAIEVSGVNLALGKVDALGDIELQGSANVGYDHVVAGGGLDVTAGKLLLNGATSDGLLSAGQGVALNVQGSAQARQITSGTDIQVNAASLAANVLSAQEQVQVTTAQELAAQYVTGGSVALHGGSVSLGMANAIDGTLTAQAARGDVSAQQLSASDAINVRSAGGLSVARGVYGGSDVNLVGASVNVGEAVAGMDYRQSMQTGRLGMGADLHDLQLVANGANGEVHAGNVGATGNVRLLGDGNVSYVSAVSGQDTEVSSSHGDTALGSTRSMGNLIVNTTHTAHLGSNAQGTSSASAASQFDVDGALVVTAQDVDLSNSSYSFGGYYVDARKSIDVDGASLHAKANAARGIDGNIVFRADNILSDAHTSLVADGAVSLASASGDLRNQGTLQSGGVMELLSPGAIVNDGQIKAGGNLVVAALDGTGAFTRSASFSNSKGAVVISANGDVAARTQDFHNLGSVASTQGQIAIDAGSVSASGNIAANKTLRMDADDWIHVTGNVSAGQAIAISADRFSNDATANVQASGDVYVGKLDSKGQLTRSTSIDNGGMLNSTHGNVFLSADRVDSHAINANEAVVVNAGDINTSGNITAINSAVHLLATGSIAVTGDIQAGKEVALFADSVANASSTISAQGDVLIGKDVDSNGLVRNTTTSNGGSIRSNSQHITVAANTLSNTGSVNALGGDVLILSGVTNNTGRIAGGDVSLSVDADFDAKGQINADKTLKVVSSQGSIRVNGQDGASEPLTGGDIQLQAGKDIVITAATLDATGNAAEGLAGNILLKAGGDVQINAVQTSSSDSQQSTSVKNTDWQDGLIHVARTETTTTRWTENTYQLQSSNVQASNDIAIQAGGAIKVFASDVSAGNGQVYAGQTISLLAGKTGTEKVNQSVHFVAEETGCVAIICEHVVKADTTTGLSDESAPARVAQIHGSVDALKSRIDVAVLEQQIALRNASAAAQGANDATQVNASRTHGPGTVKAGVVALDGAIDASTPTATTKASVDTLPGAKIGQERVQTLASKAPDIAGPKGVTPDTGGSEGTQVIPQETRSKYTDAGAYTQSSDFISRVGYANYATDLAHYANAQAQDAQDASAHAGSGTGSMVKAPKANVPALQMSGSILNTALSPVSALTQNGNIVMQASNGITGEGSIIDTSGRVDLSTTNGDIRFTPIEQNSSSLTIDSARVGNTSVLTRTLSETTSWVTGSVSGAAGVSMHANNGAIVLDGTDVMAQNGDIDLGANSIEIASVKNSARLLTDTQTSGFLYDKNSSLDATTKTTQASQLVAGNNLTLRGQDAVNIRAADLTSGGDTGIYAGYDASGRLVNQSASVTITAARDSYSASESNTESGLFVGKEDNWLSLFGSKSDTASMGGTVARGASISAGGNVTIQAGRDIAGEAVTVASAGNTKMLAGNNVRLDAVAQEFHSNSSSKSSSVGIGNFEFNAAGGDASVEMGHKGSSSTSHTQEITHVGSSVTAGGNLDINAGRNIDVIGSQVAAGNDMNLNAANDIHIASTVDSSESHGTQDNLFAGIRLGISTPISQALAGTIANTKGAVTNAQKGEVSGFFKDGHSALESAKELREALGKVAEVLKPAKAAAGEGGDNPAAGLQLATVKADATLRTDHTSTSDSSQTVQGSQLAAGNNLSLSAGRDVSIQASTLQAGGKLGIDAGNDIHIIEGYNSASSTSKTTGVDLGVGVDVGINGRLTPSLADVYARGTLSGDGSASQSRAVVGSSLQGGDVQLNAGRDINVRAADVNGTTVALNAKNNINLASAQSTSQSATGGGSISGQVAVGLGAEFVPSSLGVDASANYASSKDASSTQTNTHINGAKSVSFSSGADTNLKGAVIQGGTVTGVVGGNLNVESRQDTASSSKGSVGGDLSASASETPSFSFHLDVTSQAAAKQWVTEQSGIKAEGPLDIKVGGNTSLVGGMINSASNQLNLQTGSLSFANVQDYDWSASSFVSLSGGVTLPKGKTPEVGVIPSFVAGFDYASKRQTTNATLGAGNVSVGGGGVPAGLNRDPGSAQTTSTDDKFKFAVGF